MRLEKIRIVYIIHSLKTGGSQKVLVQMVQAQDPLRYEPFIVSLSPADPENSIFNVIQLTEQIPVYYLEHVFFEDHSLRGYYKLLKLKATDFRVLPALNGLIQTIAPHIIHFHTNPMELVLQRFLPKQIHYVFTDHLYRLDVKGMGGLKTRLLALAFRRLYKRFHVMAVSPAIYKRLSGFGIVKKPFRLLLLPNGVDFDRLAPVTDPPNGLKVVYVSRLEKIKGHEDLLKAWTLLSDIHDKHLYLVGPDGMNGRLQQMAKDLGINDTVTFTGSVPDPLTWLRKANVGIFPSYNEGLPLALLEKMGVALPVIVSDIDALKGIITEGEDGMIYKGGDVEALVQKLRYVFTHPKEAAGMGKNARQLVKEHYDLKENHRLLFSFYNNVLSG